MKISDILAQARSQLEKSGVSNSKLDSLILLTHALCVSKEQIIFNPDLVLDQNQQQRFLSLVERRSKREPISQIINKREFFGHDFVVTSDVLDPRPDSESLIELVLKKFPDQAQKLEILEIGTGSGCLITTLLLLYKSAQGSGVDISDAALKICQKNSELHQINDRLNLTKSDLFLALSQNKKFDLIISNPPYIQSQEIETLEAEVRIFEPRIALDGGPDGLDFYRRIAAEAGNFLQESARIILEIGFGQQGEIVKIFTENNFIFEESKQDLAGADRALSFRTCSRS